jgi:acyl carrier protein
MLLVGGENVYTTEVEAVFRAHPAVRQTAVFGIPNGVMGELVAASVTLNPAFAAAGASAAVSFATSFQRGMVEWCRSRLADYKVPVAVHVIDAMPTTGSGKPLKTELRRMFASPGSTAAVMPHPSPADIREDGDGETMLSAEEVASQIASHLSLTVLSNQSLHDDNSSSFSSAAPTNVEIHPELTLMVVADLHSLKLEIIMNNLMDGNTTARHIALLLVGNGTPQSDTTLSQQQHWLDRWINDDGIELMIVHLGSVTDSCVETGVLSAALSTVQDQLPPLNTIVVYHDEDEKVVKTDQGGAATTHTYSHSDVTATVLKTLAGLVGQEAADRIKDGEPLMSAGVTSILAIQLVNALEDALSTELPGTLVFDYPNVEEITEFIAESAVVEDVTQASAI